MARVGSTKQESPLAAIKTKPTGASVDAYLASKASPEQMADCKVIMAICRRITKHQPKMWGPSIVGYGSFTYTYESGHSGTICSLLSLSAGRTWSSTCSRTPLSRWSAWPGSGSTRWESPACTSGSLADLDVKVLEALIAGSVAEAKRRYPKTGEADAELHAPASSRKSSSGSWPCSCSSLVVGAVWEQVQRRAAARRFPPQGTLVDIGGRKIQLDCRGSGSPTVVLIHGLDTGGALSWSAVHDSIARTTRTCGILPCRNHVERPDARVHTDRHGRGSPRGLERRGREAHRSCWSATPSADRSACSTPAATATRWPGW